MTNRSETAHRSRKRLRSPTLETDQQWIEFEQRREQQARQNQTAFYSYTTQQERTQEQQVVIEEQPVRNSIATGLRTIWRGLRQMAG